MNRRIALGQVFGIPVALDASWLIILFLVSGTLARGYFPVHVPGLSLAASWCLGLVAALLLFGCVLLHELGHSLVAKAYGIPVHQVTLFIFGGVAQISRDPRRPLVELVVALGGPLVSVALTAGCLWGSVSAPLRTEAQLLLVVILRYLATVNLALLLFNLLPGFPLDGGRVLRAALWAWWGDLRKATRVASLLGSGLGFGLMVLGLVSLLRGRWVGGVWYVLLGMFLRDAARAGYQDVVMRQGGAR